MRNLNENGRSMVEMLGVLAIIGVLSAGGLAGYSKAMFKHKLNSTVDQITMLATAIRTHYGEQGNYVGLSNAKATKLGIVPAAMLNQDTGDGDTLVSPFNGSVYITTAGTKSATDNATGFTIAYDRLPQEACIALATSDFGSGAGSGFIGVSVTGVANSADAPAAEDMTADTALIGGSLNGGEGKTYTIATASSACKANSKNAIIWKFY